VILDPDRAKVPRENPTRIVKRKLPKALFPRRSLRVNLPKRKVDPVQPPRMMAMWLLLQRDLAGRSLAAIERQSNYIILLGWDVNI
jgi:hypothetical protein